MLLKVLESILAIFFLLSILYLASRFISAGWYKSKQKFEEWKTYYNLKHERKG